MTWLCIALLQLPIYLTPLLFRRTISFFAAVGKDAFETEVKH